MSVTYYLYHHASNYHHTKQCLPVSPVSKCQSESRSSHHSKHRPARHRRKNAYAENDRSNDCDLLQFCDASIKTNYQRAEHRKEKPEHYRHGKGNIRPVKPVSQERPLPFKLPPCVVFFQEAYRVMPCPALIKPHHRQWHRYHNKRL